MATLTSDGEYQYRVKLLILLVFPPIDRSS